MPRGGKRVGAGVKSTWKHGKTKSVRIPIALADEVLRYARELDRNVVIERETESKNLSTKDIMERETESKVTNLSGISIRQHEGAISIYLEDLVRAGYQIQPETVSKLVEARIQKLLVDKRLKYGNNSEKRR